MIHRLPACAALLSSAAVLAGVLLATSARAAPPTPRTHGGAAPAVAAPPDANRVLARLPRLRDRRYTPIEKAKLGLRLLRDEMVSPTPHLLAAARSGAPGGAPALPATATPAGHDGVLARITAALAEGGADAPYLRHVWERANAGEVKDCLAILLVLRGGKEMPEPAVHAVAEYAGSGRNPLWLRELAVRALGKRALAQGDGALAPALARALREDRHAVYLSALPGKAGAQPAAGANGAGGPVRVVYPVRRAAARAIRELAKRGVLLPSYVTQAAERAVLEAELPAAKG